MFKYGQFSPYTTIGQNNFGNKIPMFFHAFFYFNRYLQTESCYVYEEWSKTDFENLKHKATIFHTGPLLRDTGHFFSEQIHFH